MNLHLFVTLKGGPVAVARLIGCRRETLWNWLVGKSQPDLKYKLAIFKVSEGEVTANDLLYLTPAMHRHGTGLCPGCGRVITIGEMEKVMTKVKTHPNGQPLEAHKFGGAGRRKKSP